MSTNKEITLAQKVCNGIWQAQKKLFERKAKLEEPVIVADANGNPIEISASEALARLIKEHPEI